MSQSQWTDLRVVAEMVEIGFKTSGFNYSNKEANPLLIVYEVVDPAYYPTAVMVELMLRHRVECLVKFNESEAGTRRFVGFTPKTLKVMMEHIKKSIQTKHETIQRLRKDPESLPSFDFDAPVPPFVKVMLLENDAVGWKYRIEFATDMPGLRKWQLERLLLALGPNGLLAIPQEEAKKPI